MGISYYDVWKKRMKSNGDIVQSRLNNTKNIFNNSFKDDPSYKIAKLKKKDNLNEEIDLDTRIVNVDTNTRKKKIYVRPDTNINVGDYFIYPNKTYLAFEVEDNLISPYAECQETNHLLQWIIDGNLYSTQSFVTNKTKYTLGIQTEVAGITEDDSRLSVDVPFNNITKKISTGQRFIINNQAWKVTQVDFTSINGLLSLLLGQTAINYEIDDLENSIAGAFETKHTYTWNIPVSFEVSQDSEYILPYSIVDETGKDIDYSLVTVSSNDNSLISITKIDKIITIKGLNIGVGTIKLDIPVGETVEEKVINFEVKSIPVNQIDYETKLTNGTLLKVYSGTTFNCTKSINGIKQDDLSVQYELDLVGQNLVNSKDISVIQNTSSSVSIKNLKVMINKTFVIIIKDSSDGTVITTQTIGLSGM